MEDVDIVTARAIALLPPSSRCRLDEKLRSRKLWPETAQGAFRANQGEIDFGLIQIEIRRNKIASEIWFSPKAKWRRHALHVTTEMPDTIIAALRKKPLASIVEHPLLNDLTISSARRDGDTVIIETKRQPLIAISSIVSTGRERTLDLIETLQELGVERVCRVAADLVRTVPQSMRHILAARLAETKASRLDDLVAWRPSGAQSIRVYASEGCLQASVQFTVGQFNAGSLTLYGARRTNGKILNGPFARFRALYSNHHRTRLKNPQMTLGELAEHLQPAQLAKAA